MAKGKKDNLEMYRRSNRQPDQVEIASPPKDTNSPAVIPVFIAFVFFSTAAAIITLNFVCTFKYKNKIAGENSAPEQVIPAITRFMGLMLVVQTIMAEWMEVIQEKTKNIFYRCHVNIIWNHILWTLIFLGLVQWDIEGLLRTKLLMNLVDVFLVGRVLFTIGYMVGVAAGFESFRSIGFGLTLAPVVAVSSIVFKFRFIEYFS